MRAFLTFLGLSALFAALACIALPGQAANPDALWQIASQQCVPNSINTGDPKPCAMVDRERGFVILKDIVGAAQYLLIPTARLAGIESRDLLQADAPNYWRYAWEQRHRVGEMLGRPLEPSQLGLEVNSAAARSQLQLHIHIDCVRADMPGVLRAHRNDPFGQWMPLALDGHTYSVMRLPGEALQTQDPFKLAAARSAYAAGAMAAQSLLLTGARFDDGGEGFYLVNMPVNFDKGEPGSAEVLLDHDCAIAR
ncbi:CDP-diacylglycerol diphosphatase [Herbaspirillum sp. RV1423]|uniref:CDP-diacylglycerol diphosphatase n=1 Tax=Herbaspirillum sp. RV1423 TaxID=1443993 RepID=UPI0004ADC319|nr:CDP-diacylglycerol diphosphatase [Herbaspirillum sp. RV1423]